MEEAIFRDDYQIILLREARKRISPLNEFKQDIKKFINFDAPDRVSIEAARALATIGDSETADLLFGLFDRASGSQKRELLHAILENYKDVPTLRRVVRKIVSFYDEPRFDFDIFDQFSREITPIGRLSIILRGDTETINFLQSLLKSQEASLGAEEFAKGLLSVLD